ALRLARFNVQSSIGKASGDFTGLPIPMAAGVIACFVAVSVSMEETAPKLEFLNVVADFLTNDLVRKYFFLIAGLGLALAMVSNITYRSHKTFKIGSMKPFKLLVMLVALVGLVAYEPEFFGFLFFF